ncbi:acid phosphatase [Stenotrophomonas ginsengisoli]|uniref:Acid phosphatase n=1 Tax=Stenotrophomonas ginsengisoli TaxID=336566 RepID=A0A0R0DMN9_9GAMM|nr:HAD family acid phosphatase [Stenotrophomonas ginsengisoli]KRG79316.1 acid phosphatase [Stenotrophomonas ginsengisoli]
MTRTPTLTLLAAAVLALAGCASTAPRSAPVASPAAVVAADDNLNAVLWVQTAQEYSALTTQTWRAAQAQLDVALADTAWTALLPGEGAELQKPTLPPAVIVDIDETMLDNAAYQARLVVDGKSYGNDSWAAWVAERRATPVPGALEFAKAAAAKGVTIVYISNRTHDMMADTVANLRHYGFPVDEANYYGLGVEVPGCTPHGSEKGCRRIAAASKYRVLLQVGDQITDMAQVTSNSRAERDALFNDHKAWFGQRWFVLPGPTYGGYEPAAFGNDWSQPADVRRAKKHQALELAR